MQTFSNMRRNSLNLRGVITPLFIFFIAIIYQSLSSIYIFLTPLLGLCFYYLYINFDNYEKSFEKFLVVLYLLYFEIDKGFFLGSSIIFFLLLYKLILKPLNSILICQKCLIVSFVAFSYLGYYLLNVVISFIFNLELPSFGLLYFIYIFSDILLVLVLL